MFFQIEFWQLNKSKLHVFNSLLTCLDVPDLASADISYVLSVLKIEDTYKDDRAKFAVKIGSLNLVRITLGGVIKNTFIKAVKISDLLRLLCRGNTAPKS